MKNHTTPILHQKYSEEAKSKTEFWERHQDSCKVEHVTLIRKRGTHARFKCPVCLQVSPWFSDRTEEDEHLDTVELDLYPREGSDRETLGHDSVVQLHQIAKDNKIKGHSSMKKSELIDAIVNAWKTQALSETN